MGNVDDIVQGAIEAVGDDVHDQLSIAVEEGDGAITVEFLVWLPGFEEKADDTSEELGEGAGGGGVFEGRVEDVYEGRDNDVLEVAVELVGEPIKTGGGATTDRGEGDVKIFGRQEAIPVETFCEGGMRRGEGAREGGEAGRLSSRVGMAEGEKAGGGVRGEKRASVSEGHAYVTGGGEGDSVRGGRSGAVGAVEGFDDRRGLGGAC